MRLKPLITLVATLSVIFALTGTAYAQTNQDQGGTVVTAKASDSGNSIQAWECPAGYSCYYDGHGGTNRIWIAPSCGFFDLGHFNPPLNDRISSIYNRGGGSIQPYNWVG